MIDRAGKDSELGHGIPLPKIHGNLQCYNRKNTVYNNPHLLKIICSV